MNFREQWVTSGNGASLERQTALSRETLPASAEALGLVFEPRPERNGFQVRAEPGDEGNIGEIAAAIRAGTAVMAVRDGEAKLLIAPDGDGVQLLAARIAEQPGLRDRLVITTPAAIRRLLLSAHQTAFTAHAIHGLRRERPDLSAQQLFAPTQLVAILSTLIGIAFAIYLAGWLAVAALDILAGLLFFAIIMVRMQAITLVTHNARQRPSNPPTPDPARLPVYTILLPLHDEAHMVGDLLAAMERLVWPKEKLDIKLIVEADDARTISAIAALRVGPPYELIRVPAAKPRTKPKALAFALPLARGDFVTVYDAEDRPDPMQLIEAYTAFTDGDADLACLQAPLLIDNADTNGLTALFALEYSVQFDGVLPWLATLDMPLPLGGTSNHFRREALERVGGWDPYNVTEDADLGIRLARFGYHSATIRCPTYEEAPATVKSWLSQRTRWLKGWMQTVLVHLRAPRRLWREIGAKRFIGFMLTSVGSLVAAAVHPLYIATALVMIFDPARLWRADSPLLSVVTALNITNFIAAYLVFAVLSRQTYRLRRQRRPSSALLYLPAYWLLLSIACYRAIFQLLLAPHHWAKTRHVGRRERGPRAAG